VGDFEEGTVAAQHDRIVEHFDREVVLGAERDGQELAVDGLEEERLVGAGCRDFAATRSEAERDGASLHSSHSHSCCHGTLP
jgi:hypothetical protein